METKKYTELTVNERINYKSGWDIAIAYEGRVSFLIDHIAN